MNSLTRSMQPVNSRRQQPWRQMQAETAPGPQIRDCIVNNDFFQRLQRYGSERGAEIVFQNLREDRRETLTYKKFISEAADLGGFLLRLHLVSGDRVGLLIEDGPRWGVAFVAGYSAGLVLVPLDPLQDLGAIAATVSDAGCKLLLVSECYLDLARKIERRNVEIVCLQEGRSRASSAIARQ